MSRRSTAIGAVRAILTAVGVFAATACGSVENPVAQLPNATHPDTVVNGKNRVYISSENQLVIYKYARDYYLGKLTGLQNAKGLCMDAAGDVYATNFSDADIFEFIVGQSAPRLINASGPNPVDCAVDPSSGNLAVANEYGKTAYSAGGVAIYQHAKGTPRIYEYPGFLYFTSCAYDTLGNLLVSGTTTAGEPAFAYLAAGGKKLESLTLPIDSGWLGPSYVRWDGRYFVADFIYNTDFLIFVRYALAKQSGTQIGTTSIRIFAYDSAPFWVGKIGGSPKQREANALAAATNGGVYFLKYPSGTLVYQLRYGIASRGSGITVSAK